MVDFGLASLDLFLQKYNTISYIGISLNSETKETSTIRMKSFQLNKSLLEDLSTTINDEYQKSLKEEKDEFEKKHIKLEYELETKNKKIETGDFHTVLKHWNPDNFKEIKMYFRGSKKSITIRCGNYWKLDVSVSGVESIWVSGITKNFEDILEKYKTKNKFFHKSEAYLIYLGIPILIGFGILMLVTPLIDEQIQNFEKAVETDESDEPLSYLSAVIIIFAVMLNSGWGWASLFQWLFPKIEIENSIKPKVRKSILAGIVTLVISIIAGGIFSVIQNLSI